MQADNVIPFTRKVTSISLSDAAPLAFDFSHYAPTWDRSEEDCQAVLAWVSWFMQQGDKPFDFPATAGPNGRD